MLAPYTVARYGLYFAIAVAVLSIWLGQRAGASLDFSLLRAVFVFLLFTVIAFLAEAVLTIRVPPKAAIANHPGSGKQDDDV